MFGIFSSLRTSFVSSSSSTFTQIANFSKYISNSRTKRIPLNTKRVGKGYYKGKGARKEGYITNKGKFVLQPELMTELVIPDLTNFPLKPYIASGVKRGLTAKHVTADA